MKIKRSLTVISILLIAIFCLQACASSTPTPSPNPAPSTTPTPAPVKPVTLKWADFSPADTSRTATVQWMADEIEKRTNGEVKFELYFSQSLVQSRDIPEAIRDGLADAGMIFPPYYGDKFPMTSVCTLLTLSQGLEETPKAVTEFIKTEPMVIDEFNKWNLRLLYNTPAAPPTLFTTKSVTKLSDIKGLKLRALGFNGLVYKPLEAVSVNVPMPEVYEALQRGTIDGAQYGLHVWWGYGHADAAKFWLDDSLGDVASNFHCISKSAWDKLTQEQQTIIDDVCNEAFDRVAQAVDDELNQITSEAKDLGLTINSLSEAEHAKWVEMIGSSITDAWLKSMEDKGLSDQATEVLEKYREILTKNNASF